MGIRENAIEDPRSQANAYGYNQLRTSSRKNDWDSVEAGMRR